MKKIRILLPILALLCTFIPQARAADVTPPTVPKNFGVLYTMDNSATFTWEASSDYLDPMGISYVIYKNGGSAGTATSIPYTLTGLEPNTTYTFTVAARDSSGNVSDQSNQITAATIADTVRPIGNITAPLNNALITGTVSMTASSTDDIAVALVQFTVDGYAYGDPVTASPYTASLNANNFAKNSRHTLGALIYDTSGNIGTAPAISFSVGDPTAPVPYAINIGQISYSSAVVTWLTSSGATGVVKYGPSTDYGTTLRETSPTTAHKITLTNLQSNQTYHVEIGSELSGYSTATSTDQVFTTLALVGSGDTAPPVITVSSPADNSIISGTVGIQVSATDGYTMGEFQSGLRAMWATVDNSPLGVEQTHSPATISWNTANYSNGRHAVTIYAQDNYGNTASKTINCVIDNTAPVYTSSSTHPNGSLVLDGTTIFVIKNGQLFAFRDPEEYKSYGYNFGQAVAAASSDRALSSAAEPLKAMAGTLVLDSADGKTVYMIGDNGTKRGFASAEAFKGLGYTFNNLYRINLSDYPSGTPINSSGETHPNGALILDGSTVYWVLNGQRLPFESLAVFNSYGFSFSRLVPANAADRQLPEGTAVKLRDGTLVKDGSDYYIISDGKKLKFATESDLAARGYKTANAISTSLANYALGSLGE